MSAPGSDRFPLEAPTPATVPTGETYLRTLARTRPRDLTGDELLSATATLVEKLYRREIDGIVVQDSVTVAVEFGDDSTLHVELLADDAPLTREDLDWFLDLHPDGQLLIVFAGPIASDARALCADHPRVDYAAVTTTVADGDSQVVDWLNAHATVETEDPPTATA